MSMQAGYAIAALCVSPLLAIVCPRLPPCQRIFADSFIVLGRVVRVGPPISSDRDSRDVTFQMEEVLFGSSSFRFFTVRGWLYEPDVGNRFLVDAQRDPQGVWRSRICGSTDRAERQQEFIDFLRQRKQGKGETSLRISRRLGASPAIASISLAGPSGWLTAEFDDRRLATFHNIQPGTYTLHPPAQAPLPPLAADGRSLTIPAQACFFIAW